MTKIIDQARFFIGAAFSERYDFKRRFLEIREKWEEAGYDFDHILKNSVLVPETHAVFIPVQKASCTSIKHSISNKQPFDVTLEDSLDIHNHPEAYGLTRLWKSKISIADLEESRAPCFTVVRHPIDRFWSVYRHLCIKQLDYKLAGQVARYCNLKDTSEITPFHLCNYIKGTAPENREIHVKEQWRINGFGFIKHNLVGKVEELKEFYEVGISLGLLPKRAIYNLKRHNRSDDVLIEKTSMEKEIEKIVYSLYEKDFEYFNY